MKLYIHYLYKRQPGSQFPLAKWAKKTLPEEQHSRQEYSSIIFTEKLNPYRRPPYPLVKTNHPVSPQMEHRNGLKCFNMIYTGNIITFIVIYSHSLQWQLTAFHFLKVTISFTFFMSLDTMFQTFSAEYLRELIPKCSEFIFRLVKSI